MSEAEYDATEAALFATLQAAEYRTPYTPPPTWPTYECDHEWIEIRTLCDASVLHICALCGEAT